MNIIEFTEYENKRLSEEDKNQIRKLEKKIRVLEKQIKYNDKIKRDIYYMNRNLNRGMVKTYNKIDDILYKDTK